MVMVKEHCGVKGGGGGEAAGQPAGPQFAQRLYAQHGACSVQGGKKSNCGTLKCMYMWYTT